MSEREPVRVEATGETVGRGALGGAARARAAVSRTSTGMRSQFVVVSEGQRGLLGVGYEPARVMATLTEVPEVGAAGPVLGTSRVRAGGGGERAATAVRGLMDEVVDCAGAGRRRAVRRGARARVEATVRGAELGLADRQARPDHRRDAVPGQRDAAPRRAARGGGGDRREGYRKRRERTLAEVAASAADEARRTGRAGGAGADDVGGAQDRPHQGAGAGRAGDRQRGRGAQPLRGRARRSRA